MNRTRPSRLSGPAPVSLFCFTAFALGVWAGALPLAGRCSRASPFGQGGADAGGFRVPALRLVGHRPLGWRLAPAPAR
eukprot:10438156-Alexandrium_andersonii.AAC.1